MWTTAATFYGLMFVDFPSLQQLGCWSATAWSICGVLTLLLVPALLPRHAPRRARAARCSLPGLAAWIGARRRLDSGHGRGADRACSASRRAVCGSIRALDRLRSVTEAARLEERIGSAFGCRPTVYVVLAEGANLNALSKPTSDSPSDSPRSYRACACRRRHWFLPSEAAQATCRSPDRAARDCLQPPCARHSSTARALSTASGRIVRAVRRAAAAAARHDAAPHLRRLCEPWPQRSDRSVHRPRRRPMAARDLRVLRRTTRRSRGCRRSSTRWIPRRRSPGLPLVNRELAGAFVPQFVKGLTIGARSCCCSSSRRSATGACRCSRCCRQPSA